VTVFIAEEAGFRNVEIISQNCYSQKEIDSRLVGKITSIKVRAYKELR